MAIDPDFFALFVDNNQHRAKSLLQLGERRRSGELSPQAAAQAICDEMHQLAGEAGLIELHSLSAVARALSEGLRQHRSHGDLDWNQIDDWLREIFNALPTLAADPQANDELFRLLPVIRTALYGAIP